MEKIVSDVIKIIDGSKTEIEMEKVLWTFLLNAAETLAETKEERHQVFRLRGYLKIEIGTY